MNRDEAIRELKTAKTPRLPFDEVRRKKACQLGIEALELKQQLTEMVYAGKTISTIMLTEPLPSETEEEK